MTKKKSGKTMRLAGLLLVLVLVTSCFVGGTFAKYVTSGGGADEARVAKFGVNVSAVGDVFAKEYDAKDPTLVDYNGDAIAKSVIAADGKDVVAPGTKKDDALVVSVTGTPEVAVEVKYEGHVTFTSGLPGATSNWKDEAGKYYCPLVITVNGTKFNGMDYDSETEFANAVVAAIDGLTKNYAPNTDLNASASKDVHISWEWPFENATGSKYDQSDVNDTYLGNQAAAGNVATVGIIVTTTVTQID